MCSDLSLTSLTPLLHFSALYGLAPIVGKIFDAFGVAILMPLGSFLIVLAIFMLSICEPNQTYQYFLSQVSSATLLSF